MSKCKSATIFDFFGGALSGAKMVMMVRHVKDGETVLQCWQAESVKYDTCFQKSSYLPWRLKFGHLGASGYQIYFSVYRVESKWTLAIEFCESPWTPVKWLSWQNFARVQNFTPIPHHVGQALHGNVNTVFAPK